MKPTVGEVYVHAGQAIVSITLASPAVVEVTGHNLKTGQKVKLVNGDMDELPETWYPVTVLTADTFSIPFATQVAVLKAAVSIANDTITVSGNTWGNYQPFVYNNGGGASITGLTHGNTYYTRDVDGDTFKLSATAGGAVIDLTGTGNDAQTFDFTTYTAGGTVEGAFMECAAGARAKQLSLINGSVTHVPTVPVYINYGRVDDPPDDVTIPSVPGDVEFLDIGQSADVANVHSFKAAVSSGGVYLRYRFTY